MSGSGNADFRRYLPAILEFGPLAGFFVGYRLGGIQTATIVLIVCTLTAISASYIIHRRIAFTPLFSALAAIIFGGLTLLLKDEIYIKLKPTLINLLFAAILLGGLVRRKGLLKHVMGVAIEMTEAGWLILSRNYAFFFLFLAGLNEYVWRHFPTPTWVSFKVFGITALTMVFSVVQILAIRPYLIPSPETTES